MTRQVVFYTRERCCLCDDAMAVVERVHASVPFSLRVVDIDTDLALVALYGDKVPVITVDGRLHAKYRVDADAFARRLRSDFVEVEV